MKKIDRLYIKGRHLLIGGVACLFGNLTSCSLEDSDLAAIDTPQTESGAIFGVKGKVVTQDNRPLKNILIEIPNDINDSQPYKNIDIRYTDDNGLFEWKRQASPKDQTFRFVIKDIDGDKNGGKFNNDTIDVKFTLKQLSESGGDGIWNYGSVTQNINIKLNKKE